MKTAISVPDPDFQRYERIAAQHGMNRSQFFRLAAGRLADELEGGSELTAIGDAVLAQAMPEPDDDLFVREAERRLRESVEW